jgi:hypothetical protein
VPGLPQRLPWGEGPGGARERDYGPVSDLRRPAGAGHGRAGSQRGWLSAGGRVRSMTIAAVAQAAHPPMDSSAPMLGSHES